MHRAGVSLQQCAGISVAVANGDKVISLGRCPRQRVTIGKEAFDIDFYALPLGGFDLVLGVQWLDTLGPSLWNFSGQTLSFAHGGKLVTWTGVDASYKPSVASLVSSYGDFLKALLAEFAILFQEPQSLPPQRHLCHRIRLQYGTTTVQFVPTVTLTFRRMSWSANVMTCFALVSFVRARPRSPRRHYLSRSVMAPGVFAWIVVL